MFVGQECGDLALRCQVAAGTRLGTLGSLSRVLDWLRTGRMASSVRKLVQGRG